MSELAATPFGATSLDHFSGEGVEVETASRAECSAVAEAVLFWGDCCRNGDEDGSLEGREVCVHTLAPQPSLEVMFHQEVTTIDLGKTPDFRLFLSPNEFGVLAVCPHLPSTRGVDVSTGTERSFFDLALRGSKSEGLVVRDVHPYVKAYVDFNTLLLRIAKDREHYVQLSTSPEKIEEIRTLMEAEASLPPHMKQYYREHLDAFAKIYFEETKKPEYWRSSDGFDGVKYYEDDVLFHRLQQHARSGNIIATVGDISDLRFLDQRIIATLDLSNIPDYSILNIQTRSQPKIIITTLGHYQTKYGSSFHHQLTEQQKDELDELLRIARQMQRSHSWTFGRDLHRRLMDSNPEFSEVNSSVYSESLLNALKRHKDLYWRQICGKWVDFSPGGNWQDWGLLFTASDLQNISLEDCRTLAPFLPPLLAKRYIFTTEMQKQLFAIQDRLASDTSRIRQFTTKRRGPEDCFISPPCKKVSSQIINDNYNGV